MITDNQPMTFHGMKLVESPYLPYQRLKVSSDCPMTEAYRSEINQWLLDTFGMVDTLVMGPVNMIAMSAEALRKVRALVHLQTEARNQLSHDLLHGTGTNKPNGIMRSGRK